MWMVRSVFDGERDCAKESWVNYELKFQRKVWKMNYLKFKLKDSDPPPIPGWGL